MTHRTENSNGIRVQVIDRIFTLMKTLTQLESGARLIEIASKSGLHASTACRLLNDMAAGGLVKTAGHGRYSIGFTRLNHGPALFQFASYTDWVNKSKSRYDSLNGLVLPGDFITLDCAGRVCTIGRHMKRAEAEDCFPVTVYHIDPDWRHPADKAQAPSAEATGNEVTAAMA